MTEVRNHHDIGLRVESIHDVRERQRHIHARITLPERVLESVSGTVRRDLERLASMEALNNPQDWLQYLQLTLGRIELELEAQAEGDPERMNALLARRRAAEQRGAGPLAEAFEEDVVRTARTMIEEERPPVRLIFTDEGEGRVEATTDQDDPRPDATIEQIEAWRQIIEERVAGVDHAQATDETGIAIVSEPEPQAEPDNVPEPEQEYRLAGMPFDPNRIFRNVGNPSPAMPVFNVIGSTSGRLLGQTAGLAEMQRSHYRDVFFGPRSRTEQEDWEQNASHVSLETMDFAEAEARVVGHMVSENPEHEDITQEIINHVARRMTADLERQQRRMLFGAGSGAPTGVLSPQLHAQLVASSQLRREDPVCVPDDPEEQLLAVNDGERRILNRVRMALAYSMSDRQILAMADDHQVLDMTRIPRDLSRMARRERFIAWLQGKGIDHEFLIELPPQADETPRALAAEFLTRVARSHEITDYMGALTRLAYDDVCEMTRDAETLPQDGQRDYCIRYMTDKDVILSPSRRAERDSADATRCNRGRAIEL